MIQCKICNRELNSYTGLASHINQVHNLLSKDYAKYECMIKNNVKIISDEEIKPILDYINEKYGKNYLKQFKYEK